MDTLGHVRGDLDGEPRLTAALVENLQREDLNPVEEAEAFAALRAAVVSPHLAWELAHDLDATVTDWRPSAR